MSHPADKQRAGGGAVGLKDEVIIRYKGNKAGWWRSRMSGTHLPPGAAQVTLSNWILDGEDSRFCAGTKLGIYRAVNGSAKKLQQQDRACKWIYNRPPLIFLN